jgi:hypothetical protein
MNREIVGGGGAVVYPLTGDVTSTAGNPSVTVTGIQNIPVIASFPTDKEVLTYDGSSNTMSLQTPAPQVEFETNGTPNSTQTLLNLVAGANITLTETAGTVLIDAGTLGTQRSATTTNANGSFWTWTDGIIEAWGTISLVATGTNKTGGTISFPTVFPSGLPNIQVTLVGLPNSGTTDSTAAQILSYNGSGAIVDAQCSVPTGGGGTTFNQVTVIHWRAIGN